MQHYFYRNLIATALPWFTFGLESDLSDLVFDFFLQRGQHPADLMQSLEFLSILSCHLQVLKLEKATLKSKIEVCPEGTLQGQVLSYFKTMT